MAEEDRGIVNINHEKHWNKVYAKNSEEKLGWYETDLTPTLGLISKTGLHKNAGVLIVGAGSTRLIDELLANGYSNLIATDISELALKNLAARVGEGRVEWIVDDLTNPADLLSLDPVDLWIDRAVLHFFTQEKDQNVYFDLLRKKVKKKGFALLAEFNLNGAKICSGLPVHRYSKEMLSDKLDPDFELTHSFDHTYINPSGSERPYVYTLFRKK